MKRKQIYIEESQEQAIKQLAYERGVSEALVIREAVAKYLSDETESPAPVTEAWTPTEEEIAENPLFGIIGLVKDPLGPTDGSVNHDHYIYGVPKKFP